MTETNLDIDATDARIAAPPARTRRLASSLLYAPALAMTGLGAALIVWGWRHHWGGADYSSTLASLRVVVVGPIALAVLLALVVCERLWPAQRRSVFARGYRQDVLYTIVNATLTLPFVAALSLSFAAFIRMRLHWLTFPHVAGVPRAVVVTVIFVAMDGCNWLAHLANHRVEALWRFHELHHSQEDMNVLTVFRTHPFVHISYLIALVPGCVLIANGGLPTTLLVAYAGFVALAHSNIRLGFGPLGRVLVSPNYHRIHHRLEGRQDVNLGFALSIWDHLFQTAVMPNRDTVAIATGLPGRPLRVEQSGTRARHFSVLVTQLLAPVRPVVRSTTSTSEQIRQSSR